MQHKYLAAFGGLAVMVALAAVISLGSNRGPAIFEPLGAETSAGEFSGASDASRKSPPDVATEIYGESVLGEPLEAVRVGSGSRVVVVIGGLHTGLEAETADLVAKLQDEFTAGRTVVPAGVRVVFVPEANPDGLGLETRVNAREVDLNRNWPTDDWAAWGIHGDGEVFGGDEPLSEPETAALHDYLVRLEPDFVVSVHGFAGVVHHNGMRRAESLGELFADVAGFELTANWEHYDVTGDLIEFMAELGVPAADVELFEDDGASLERVRRGLEALLTTMEDAGGSS